MNQTLRRTRTAMLTVLATVALSIPAGVAHASVDAPTDVHPNSLCSAGWYYRITSRGADTHSKVGPTQSDYNGTSTTAKMTLEASASGTVTSTVSGGGHITLNAKLAEVEDTYNIAVTSSVTVKLGNTIQINVPAHKTGNGDYGAWRAYVNGVEEYYSATCAVTNSSATSLHSPYKIGWRTWIS